MDQIGFIILRHVNSKLTNDYWNNCYDCIRKYYPENLIIIIDDNSNYTFINQRDLYKTTIINSEYPGRGELLPYYYYIHNKLFDTAVIIHDSVFINTYIDFSLNDYRYKIIWDFEHHWDLIEDETRIIKLFNNKELLNFYENKNLWTGCFGCMSIINHDYLVEINNEYNLNILLDNILNRYNRCSFERILACLLQIKGQQQTLLGNIHKYCEWGITINNIYKINHLPLIKVWTGR